MSSFPTMPGREPRQHDRGGFAGRGDGGAPIGICATPAGTSACSQDGRDCAILDASSPIVRALRQISALGWWRLLPADAFRAAEYLAIRSALQDVAALVEGAELEAALQGDADAAIALVLSLMPISRLGGIKTDIAMTAVLSIALEGEPQCALLLAHVIDRAERDPYRADQLCGSWIEFYFDRQRFGRQEFGRQECGGFAPEGTALLKMLRAFDAGAINRGAELPAADMGGTADAT